jgi:very-short-patch-repair endonuclease
MGRLPWRVRLHRLPSRGDRRRAPVAQPGPRAVGCATSPAARAGSLPRCRVPRTRPEAATVRAAQWAKSDRQAALVICLVVQQRLVRPERLLAQWLAQARSPRRAFLHAVIRDVCDGVHSLGELDFARLCRARGLPEPSRQAVRVQRDGRAYLDVAWDDLGLVVEIDGGHHGLALNPVDDALRQNEVVLRASRVLRIPVIGLRLDADAFMDQVVRAHHLLSEQAA